MGIDVLSDQLYVEGFFNDAHYAIPPPVDFTPDISNVRRELFGPVDHDKLNEFLDNELNLIQKQKKKKWNFDFENEKPLKNGRFVWKPINNLKDDSPYKEEEIQFPSNKVTSESQKPVIKNKICSITKLRKSKKQTIIKDYMKCTKRSKSLIGKVDNCIKFNHSLNKRNIKN